MKILIVIILLCVASLSYSQTSMPYDSVTRKLTYTAVIEVDSATAKDLFNRLKLWFATKYNSSKDVLQDINSETLSISGKANLAATANNFGARSWGYVSYTISVFCKDGRYKYIITDFIHEGDPSTSAYTYTPSVGLLSKETAHRGKGWNVYREVDYERLLQQVSSDMNNLTASLKQAMVKHSVSEEKNW